MFRKINATLKAAEASALVVKALRIPVLDWPYDPDDLGKKLVAHVCGHRPDLFGFGRWNAPPHPVATASIALAVGLQSPERFSIPERRMLFLALGTVLIDADKNQFRYGFDAREQEMIALAKADYFRFNAEQEAIEMADAHQRPEDIPHASATQPASTEERLTKLSRGIDEFERGRTSR